MRNFNFPYFSRDIAEFWRKWHISLTTWFRDYIYIPLGGSRGNKHKVVRNTFIIFLTSGLWHGANWTFIIWGLYHAFFFVPLIATKKNRKYTGSVADGRLLPSFSESLLMAWTFLIVLIGWIIFRADNIDIAWSYIKKMFTNLNITEPTFGKSALIWVAVLLIIEWIQRNKSHAFSISGSGVIKYRIIRWGIYYLMIGLILFFSGTHSDFIYFQF